MGSKFKISKSKKASKAQKTKVPPKALPVTLLSGFLGSGKTTLLQHILRSNHGLRIAVVVNDIGAINVDASLIKQTHRITKTNEKVIALQNGCICCTLRGDLLEELVRLAQLQSFDYIIIESSGISEPEQVAETFDSRLAEQMSQLVDEGGEGLDEDMLKVLEQLKEVGGLEKFAKLDTTVTVIDTFTMLHDFDTADLISARRDDVTPEDERTVSDLMVDQIEFADIIILNKIDMVSKETRTRIVDLVKKLNHRAKILESSYGKVDVKQLVNTGLFKMDVAQAGYGWLQDLHAMTVREVNGKNVVTPKPETEEYNVQSFIYSRQRPFHPRRLFALLYDKFILQLEQTEDDEDDEDDEDEDEDDEDDEEEDQEMHDIEQDDAQSVGSSNNSAQEGSAYSAGSSHTTAQTIPSPRPSDKQKSSSTQRTAAASSDDDDAMAVDPLDMPPNEEILVNKRAHPTFSRLFRSKGEFLLATRPHRAGEWSQAGAMLTMAGGRPWFCTLPAEEYTTGDAEVDALVQHDINKGGEWGDRRQELVFIGEGLDHKGVEALLDECLLTDAEMADWERVMRDPAHGEDLDKLKDALQELFDDGFPDWAGEPGDDDDEHGHEGHNHNHTLGMSGVRSIKHAFEEVS
ncbi:cobalamin synthesis protein [Beauveria bassiana ARSEF 2860]|uniref:Cobalamin synthesis protein n=1 Tax=Beauveria bassiana (strain ARSEF 2860) TaxID=655819 RepID=J4UI98_BEAB2|nr:cobalamin synthesis protein [Beauveria bassiana ARSEF 2860]EJP63187.1 cobalamin synthesis protein [Beauveria bassiana ARSEF 2860]